MGFSDFWSQSNRGSKQFNLEQLKGQDSFSLDDLSKKLNLDKEMLKSVFLKADSDKSGSIQLSNSTQENELNIFLGDLNATFGSIKKTKLNDPRYNELYEYKDAYGNNVAEYYKDGEIIQKTIINKKTEENKDEITYIAYANGRPSQKSEYKNGNIMTTTYAYMQNESGKTHVQISSFDSHMNQSHYTTEKVDSDGNPITQVLEASVVNQDKGTISELKVQDGKLYENVYDNNTRKFLHVNVYDNTTIDKYNKGTELPSAQIVPTSEKPEDNLSVEYDRAGNTYIFARMDDTWEKLAKQFKMTVAELKNLNKEIKTIAPCTKLKVKGQYSADSETLKGRITKDALKEQNKVKGALSELYTSKIATKTLKNNYKSVYDYAASILKMRGITPNSADFKKKRNLLANELLVLNGANAKYTKGSNIKVIEGTLDANLVEEFKKAGIKPTEKNQVFFGRLYGLNKKQQQNILDVVKDCQKRGITDTKKINSEILKYYPHLNMFDTNIQTLSKPTELDERKYAAEMLIGQIMSIIEGYKGQLSELERNPFNIIAMGGQIAHQRLKDAGVEDLYQKAFNAVFPGLSTIMSKGGDLLTKIDLVKAWCDNLTKGESKINLEKGLAEKLKKAVALLDEIKKEYANKDADFETRKRLAGAEKQKFNSMYSAYAGKQLDNKQLEAYLSASRKYEQTPEYHNAQIEKEMQEIAVQIDRKFGERINRLSAGNGRDTKLESEIKELLNKYFALYKKMDSMPDNKKAQARRKMEAEYKKLNIEGNAFKGLDKRIQDFVEGTSTRGMLTEMAAVIAFMVLSGGGAAFGAYGSSAGAYLEGGMSITMRQAGKSMLMRKLLTENVQVAARVLAGVPARAGIPALGSALLFNVPKAAMVGTDVVTGDSEHLVQDAEMLKEGVVGLTEFGVVGALVTGPAGQFLGQGLKAGMTSSALKKALAMIGAAGKTTKSMRSFLNNLSKVSEGVGKTVSFSATFGLNAGYMAFSDGMEYTQAVISLSQMDGVSKLVVAMLCRNAAGGMIPQLKGRKISAEQMKKIVEDVNKKLEEKGINFDETKTPEEIMTELMNEVAKTTDEVVGVGVNDRARVNDRTVGQVSPDKGVNGTQTNNPNLNDKGQYGLAKETTASLEDTLKACNKKFEEQLKEGETVYSLSEVERIKLLFAKNPKVVVDVLKQQAEWKSWLDKSEHYSVELIEKMIELSEKTPDLYSMLLSRDGNLEWWFKYNNISEFEKAYTKNPELFKDLFNRKDLKGENLFFSSDIALILDNIDKDSKIRDFVSAKIKNGNQETYAFSGNMIAAYINGQLGQKELLLMSLKSLDGKYNLLSQEQIDDVKYYLDDSSNIVSDLKNPETSHQARCQILLKTDENIRDILYNVPELEAFLIKNIPNDTYSLKLNPNSAEGTFSFTCTSDNKSTTLRFKPIESGSFEVISREFSEQNGNISNIRTEFADGRIMTEKIEYETLVMGTESQKVAINKTKMLYEREGEPIYKETYTPSDEVEGAFDIHVQERGLSTSVAGTAKKYGTKSPAAKVIRNLVSPSGMQTVSTIVQGPKGGKSSYVIKDKAEKTVINIERTNRQISENHYKSTLNGQTYEMLFEDNNIKVSKTNKNGKTETVKLGADVLDPQLRDLYKQLPGDFLFIIAKTGLKVVLSDVPGGSQHNAYEKTIYIAKQHANNPFVFAHELGHAIDNLLMNDFCNDEILGKIFQQDVAMYKNQASIEGNRIVDYFTDIHTDLLTEPNDHIKEVIAETFALSSGLINNDHSIAMRGVELQHKFMPTQADILVNVYDCVENVGKKIAGQVSPDNNTSGMAMSTIRPLPSTRLINHAKQTIQRWFGGEKETVGQVSPDKGVTGGRLGETQQNTYISAGNKVFDIKPEDFAKNPAKIKEVQVSIDELRKTEPHRADELQIVLDMFKNPTKDYEVSDAQLNAVARFIHEQYAAAKDELNSTVKFNELDSDGTFSSRIKSEASLKVKLENYLKDAIKDRQEDPEKPIKTLYDAYIDVRDAYACRTEFKSAAKGTYTDPAKIQALKNEISQLEQQNADKKTIALKKQELERRENIIKLVNEAKQLRAEGKTELAESKMLDASRIAAEIQSQPYVEKIKAMLDRIKEEYGDVEVLRLTNYTSKEGISILSREQLCEIKQYGAEKGVRVDFIKLASDIHPDATSEFVKGSSTKQQPTGYMAIQVNFRTKSGMVFEHQFRGQLTGKLAESEHPLYDLRTGKCPWKLHPELESLYKPIGELIEENVMPEEAYKNHQRYLMDYNTHLRKLELGFDSEAPRMEDYEIYTDKKGVEKRFKFDKRLSAENLIKLDDVAKAVQNETRFRELKQKEVSEQNLSEEETIELSKLTNKHRIAPENAVAEYYKAVGVETRKPYVKPTVEQKSIVQK